MRAIARRGREATDGPVAEHVRIAASSAVIDAAAGMVVEALRAAEVPSILLKGPVLDRWLYEPSDPRPYGDCDLLVAPDRVEAAGAVLGRMDFVRKRRIYENPHAGVWIRRSDGMNVDLHHKLIGVELPADQAWELLVAETEPMRVGGVDADVLAPTARTLHVALHAAQHGERVGKPLTDLERALDRLPAGMWDEAAALAAKLGATSAFATGLRLVAGGEAVAARLNLPTDLSIETALFAVSAPFSSAFVSRVAEAPGIRAKLRLALGKVAPAPDFMRAWSPLARRGRLGLALSYLWRQLWLAGHTPPAVLAWWRARRLTG